MIQDKEEKKGFTYAKYLEINKLFDSLPGVEIEGVKFVNFFKDDEDRKSIIGIQPDEEDDGVKTS